MRRIGLAVMVLATSCATWRPVSQETQRAYLTCHGVSLAEARRNLVLAGAAIEDEGADYLATKPWVSGGAGLVVATRIVVRSSPSGVSWRPQASQASAVGVQTGSSVAYENMVRREAWRAQQNAMRQAVCGGPPFWKIPPGPDET